MQLQSQEFILHLDWYLKVTECTFSDHQKLWLVLRLQLGNAIYNNQFDILVLIKYNKHITSSSSPHHLKQTSYCKVVARATNLKAWQTICIKRTKCLSANWWLFDKVFWSWKPYIIHWVQRNTTIQGILRVNGMIEKRIYIFITKTYRCIIPL